jgi:RNA polymerase sigma-70 factor (ECF subfamily)
MGTPELRLVHAPSDLALAQRCVAGDVAAQRELYHREKRRVHAVLYRLLGSNAHMDDLIQEAFLQIFRSLRNYRGEASLGTWVDRCTVRVGYGHIASKRLRAVPLPEDHDPPADQPNAESTTHAREASRRLYALLDRVEAKQRVAFVLHVVEGRPMAEVAQLMDATVVATKVRVWRARRAIEDRARRDPVLAEYVVEGAEP